MALIFILLYAPIVTLVVTIGAYRRIKMSAM